MAPPSKAQQLARRKLLYAPIITALFGPSKVGKTTVALYTYPTARVYGEPRAIRPAIDTVGWIPTDIQDVGSLKEFRESLHKAYPKPINRNVSRMQLTKDEVPYAVIADDWSTLVKRTHYELGKKFSNWDLIREIGTEVVETLLLSTRLGLDLVIIGHDKDRDDGDGGMELPTKGLIKELPKHCDVVLFQAPDTMRSPHPACFKCGALGSPNHITGSRFSVFPDEGPANLGEGLRAAGIEIPRAPGMEWAEEIVEQGATLILAGKDEEKVVQAIARKLLREGREVSEVAWVHRDLVARAEFRKYVRERRLRSLGFIDDEDILKMEGVIAKAKTSSGTAPAPKTPPPVEKAPPAAKAPPTEAPSKASSPPKPPEPAPAAAPTEDSLDF